MCLSYWHGGGEMVWKVVDIDRLVIILCLGVLAFVVGAIFVGIWWG